jgi:hypothetical protein
MPEHTIERPFLEMVPTPGSVKDEFLLASIAHSSGVAIVDRHARDVRDREALVEAIARLALIGLQGHVRLFEAEQREPHSRNGSSRCASGAGPACGVEDRSGDKS